MGARPKTLRKTSQAAGISYIKALRKELDSRGLTATKIVGGDVHSWVDPMCDAITNGSDPELAAAVAVGATDFVPPRSHCLSPPHTHTPTFAHM